MTKAKYYNMHVFIIIIVKIQLLGSEKICTCRIVFCWVFYLNQYTLLKSDREHMKIFRSD